MPQYPNDRPAQAVRLTFPVSKTIRCPQCGAKIEPESITFVDGLAHCAPCSAADGAEIHAGIAKWILRRIPQECLKLRGLQLWTPPNFTRTNIFDRWRSNPRSQD